MALQFPKNLYFYILSQKIYVYFLFKKNEGNSSSKGHHDVLMLFLLKNVDNFFTAS